MASRQRSSLRARIFWSFSLIVVVLLVAATAGLTWYLRASLLDQEQRTLANLAQKSSSQISDRISILMETAIQLGLAPPIVAGFNETPALPGYQNRFETENFNQAQEIVRALASIRTIHFSTGRVSLYDRSGSYIGYGGLGESHDRRISQFEGKLVESLWNKLAQLDGKPLVLGPHGDFWSEAKDDPVLSVLWNIKDLDTNRSFGVVEVQESWREFTKVLMPTEGTNGQVALIDQSGKPLWQSSTIADLHRAFQKAESDPSVGNFQVSQSLVAFEQVPGVPWWVFHFKSESQVLEPVAWGLVGLILASLLIMALSIGVVRAISVQLARPLSNLRKQLDQVELDKLSVSLDMRADSDVAFVDQAFIDMFARLKRSTQQLVDARNHEITAQLLALQSQMDPHFLFNMLSVLTAEARQLKAERMELLCSTLAEALRYVSDFDSEPTTMEAEFRHVNLYLNLMKFRFEGGLQFELQPCSDAQLVRVPRLILQPLVENAFRHGFSNNRPPWIIRVVASVDDARWSVTIEDNGTGIDPDLWARVQARVEEFLLHPADALTHGRIGGLGLVNTVVRLRLKYGQTSIFEIVSREDGGTRITLGGPRE